VAYKSTDFKGHLVNCIKKIMKILFCYRYRDGGNYKKYNEIVFENPNNRSLSEIEEIIRENLIDGLWFVADNWEIPNQFFDEYLWNNEIDHNWHEFDEIKNTTEEITEENTIEDLISLIKAKELR
jgi:hypothetical protein